jgi:hypothetical protein
MASRQIGNIILCREGGEVECQVMIIQREISKKMFEKELLIAKSHTNQLSGGRS